MALATIVILLAHTQTKRMFPSAQLCAEHDRAWVMQTGTEAMEQVDRLARPAVDAHIHDTRIRSGQHKRADRRALEIKRQFGTRLLGA